MFPCHEVVKNILQSPPFLLIFRSSDMQDLWMVVLWSHYLWRCRILQGQVPAQFGRPRVLRQGTENTAHGRTYLSPSSGRAARNVVLETAWQGKMGQENSASLQQEKKPHSTSSQGPQAGMEFSRFLLECNGNAQRSSAAAWGVRWKSKGSHRVRCGFQPLPLLPPVPLPPPFNSEATNSLFAQFVK